jgi:hypothetical protein
MIVSDIPQTNKPRIYFVFFADEIAGGYGYWLFDAEEAARDGVKGERYIVDIVYGSFPKAEAETAKKILDDACNTRPLSSKKVVHIPSIVGIFISLFPG